MAAVTNAPAKPLHQRRHRLMHARHKQVLWTAHQKLENHAFQPECLHFSK
jgi:hypothetical protein